MSAMHETVSRKRGPDPTDLVEDASCLSPPRKRRRAVDDQEDSEEGRNESVSEGLNVEMNREGQNDRGGEEEEELETNDTTRSEESNLVHCNNNDNDDNNRLSSPIDRDKAVSVSPSKTSSLVDGRADVGTHSDLEQETISDTSSSTSSTTSSPSFQSSPSSPPSPATLIASIAEASHKGQSNIIPNESLNDPRISAPSTPLRSPRSVNSGDKRKSSSSAASDDDDGGETFVISFHFCFHFCF